MVRFSIGASAAVSAALLACTSGGSPSAEAYAGSNGCSDAWVELCNELECVPTSADWAGCRLNGWLDKKPVETCAPNTQWDGDDMALCVPGEDEGLQLHYGPSDYNDPDEIAPYMIDPRVEMEDCLLLDSTNDQLRYVNQYSGRMRPQSHHMILWGLGEDPENPATRGLGTCAGPSLGSSFYVGSQNLRIDIPDLSTKPDPNDETAARPLPPNQLFSLNMHYLNRDTEPVLRESWINIYYADETLIEREAKAVFLVAPLINVPPRSTGTVISGGCAAPKARTVRLLNGHFHEHGKRFSVFRKRVGEERELVYASYDWSDPYIAYYTGNAGNPEPNESLGISGGISGVLQLNAGDKLEWECEFDNPTDRTVNFGETGGDQMCILFGMYIDDEEDESFNWNAASINPALPCVDSERAGGISL